VTATEEPPLGHRLRNLRRMALLSEDTLALLVGLTVGDIARIEAGDVVNLGTVGEIAKACGFDVVITFRPQR
jgi:transcriptional regulator with XRE-family HTH domain